MPAVILHDLVSFSFFFFFFFKQEMYQFGMKDLISLHSCISSGSDISAESDHYISLALHLLCQSGINLTTQKVAQVKSATSKSNIGPLLKKDIGNAGILLFCRDVLLQWICGSAWNKLWLWWKRRQQMSRKTYSWTYALTDLTHMTNWFTRATSFSSYCCTWCTHERPTKTEPSAHTSG